MTEFRVGYKNPWKLLTHTECFQYDKIKLGTAFSSDAKAVGLSDAVQKRNGYDV